MEKKRVLFMSVTAGQGHNSTCRAVMDSLQAQGVDCAMIDTMAYLGRGISKTVDKGYLGMVRFTPDMFGYFYRSMLTVKNPATREGQRVKRRLQRAVQALSLIHI